MRELLTLTAVAVPFVITPGASFTLTVSHATQSRSPGWRRVAVGTGAGLLLLAVVLGASGLGGVLTSAPRLRVALGLLGGAILIAFGVTVLTRAARPKARGAEPRAPRNLVRWSFAAVVTNPKALTLYALIVPSLASDTLRGITLFTSFAAVHIAVLSMWLCLTHHCVTRIPALARSDRLQHLLLATAGLVMIVLGIRTGIHAIALR